MLLTWPEDGTMKEKGCSKCKYSAICVPASRDPFFDMWSYCINCDRLFFQGVLRHRWRTHAKFHCDPESVDPVPAHSCAVCRAVRAGERRRDDAR